MTPESVRASLAVGGAIVLGISLVGFMRATSHDDYDFEVPLRDIPMDVHGDLVEARPYLEMRTAPRGNAVLPGGLSKLAAEVPSLIDAVDLTGTSKAEDLAARAARRAFHGAPPVIPHPAGQGTASECMACHDAGVRFGALRASPIPHEAYTSCTQCHSMDEPNVPWGAQSDGLRDDPRDVPNSFVGATAPAEGPRWTSIAPPGIPHDTFLHERCMSCHGPNGRDALQSTHPDRQSCEQCHAGQAPLEQRPGGRR